MESTQQLKRRLHTVAFWCSSKETLPSAHHQKSAQFKPRKMALQHHNLRIGSTKALSSPLYISSKLGSIWQAMIAAFK